MISIGNDIVDLNAIDINRTQQKAFYSKILSVTEQQLFSRTLLPAHVLVWLLWSAKESVYKFAKRLNPDLVFSPARIEITSEPEFRELKNFQNLILEGIELSLPFEFGESLNSINSGSDHISEYNYQIDYHSETYYLHSLISDNFIATVASNSSDFTKVNWGIKYVDATDYKSQAIAVRAFTLQKINEIFPTEANFHFDKSSVGYPIILKDQTETDLKASFAHHGNYVTYALIT